MRRRHYGGDGAVLGECVRAAEIASPSQVLPKANAATIRDRWHRWSCQIVSGCGRSIDPERPLQPVMVSAPSRCIVVNMDNAGVNNCVIGMY